MPTLDRDHAVAGEMEAVFAGLADRRRTAPRPKLVLTRPRRRARGWAALLVPVSVGLILGSAWAYRSGLAVPTAPDAVHVAARSTASPRSAPLAPVATTITGGDASAVPVTIAALAPPGTRKRPMSAAPGKPPVVAALAVARPLATIPMARAANTGTGPASQDEPVRSAPDGVRCAVHDGRDECIYRDVIAADRRLRAAYGEAVDAGVPSRSLGSIVRYWRQARGMSQDDPDEAIRRYGVLTRELGELRAGDAP